MRTLTALLFLSCVSVGCGVGDIADPPPSNSAPADVYGTWCPDDSICMQAELLEGKTIRPGRLAVVWYQLKDGDPDPEPQIAFDAPLDTSSRHIVIPIKEVRPASGEDLQYCERRCDDESICPCMSDVRVTVGTVIAADDSNGDGRLDAREVRTVSYGRGYFAVVRSEKDVRPVPSPFDRTFATPIRTGTHPFRFVDLDGSGTVALGSPEELPGLGSPEERVVFDFNPCDAPNTRCVAPAPAIRTF